MSNQNSMIDIYAALRQSVGLETNPSARRSIRDQAMFVRAIESMTVNTDFDSSEIERAIRGNLDRLSASGGDTIRQNEFDRHLGEAMMSVVVTARRLAIADRMNEASRHDGQPELPAWYMNNLRESMKVSLGNMDAYYTASFTERVRNEAAPNKEERVSSDRWVGRSRWARMAELKDRLQFNAALGVTGVALASITKIGAALAGASSVAESLIASGNYVAANAAFNVPEHAVHLPFAGMAAIAAVSVAGMGVAAVQAYREEIGEFMKSMTDKVLGTSVAKVPDVMAGMTARQDKVEVMQSRNSSETKASNLYSPTQ